MQQVVILLFLLVSFSHSASVTGTNNVFNGLEDTMIFDAETMNLDFGIPKGFNPIEIVLSGDTLTPGVNISVGFYGYQGSLVPFSAGITSDQINNGPVSVGTYIDPLERFGVITVITSANMVGSFVVKIVGEYNWRNGQPCVATQCCAPFYY